MDVWQEENKTLDRMHRQKVAEVEKLSLTVAELEEALVAGGASANVVRDYQRQVHQLVVLIAPYAISCVAGLEAQPANEKDAQRCFTCRMRKKLLSVSSRGSKLLRIEWQWSWRMNGKMPMTRLCQSGNGLKRGVSCRFLWKLFAVDTIFAFTQLGSPLED